MYEQLSLFDDLTEEAKEVDEKPAVGTKVIFHYNGKDYPAYVSYHGGLDFFVIIFTGRKPSDDNPDIGKGSGWHVSMRGRGKDWSLAE